MGNVMAWAAISVFYFVAGLGHAAILTLNNAGFEDPVVNNGEFDTDPVIAPADWSVYGLLSNSPVRHIGVLNPATTTLYAEPVPEGNNVGVIFLDGGSTEAGMVQTLSDTLALNTRYDVTVAIGNIANDSNHPHNQWDFSGFPGYRVDLLAGGTTIGSDNNSLAPAEGTFLTSSFSVAIGASHALVGANIGIRLVNLNGPGIEVNFDDVQIQTFAIPEPGAIALVFPLFLLILVRRF